MVYGAQNFNSGKPQAYYESCNKLNSFRRHGTMNPKMQEFFLAGRKKAERALLPELKKTSLEIMSEYCSKGTYKKTISSILSFLKSGPKLLV